MFQVGDKVVYPNHGIGLVRDEVEFEVAGTTARFFEVYILASKSTVKVPANNAEAVGLRKLLDKEQLEEVNAYLRSTDVLEYTDWKERFKQNSDLMRTGKVMDMVAVLKNLHFVSITKPLSFREKRMYERSMQLICTEIAEVRKRSMRSIEESITKNLNDAADALGIFPVED
jgi:CarD family transcriptional regulator